jgi:glutamate 5-kinase
MRVVIKVGTGLIAPGGQIDVRLLRGIVDQFDLSKNEYLIVTSGAIAAGMSGLGVEKPGDVPRMQACAAVGQSRLMHTYERLFFGKKVVAQLLLSSDDFTSPVRYRNLQNALAELLALGVVPIVNENDSVSVRELEGAFGDNDELSSLLATAVKADWLLLLTDVDGFMVPNRRGKPRVQRVIRRLTPALEAQCNGKSALGRGGMASKLRAARLASESGVDVAIVNGRHPQAITLGMERKIGTYFPGQHSRLKQSRVRKAS